MKTSRVPALSKLGAEQSQTVTSVGLFMATGAEIFWDIPYFSENFAYLRVWYRLRRKSGDEVSPVQGILRIGDPLG